MSDEKNNVRTLMSSVIATGAQTAVEPEGALLSLQVHGITSAGAGSATVDWEVSNDGTNYDTIATFSLTLSTTRAIDSQGSSIPYRYHRCNVTAITGTDAEVSAYMCEVDTKE